MDAVGVDRMQFGTMGLAPFVAFYTWKAQRTGDACGEKRELWTKIFASGSLK